MTEAQNQLLACYLQDCITQEKPISLLTLWTLTDLPMSSPALRRLTHALQDLLQLQQPLKSRQGRPRRDQSDQATARQELLRSLHQLTGLPAPISSPCAADPDPASPAPARSAAHTAAISEPVPPPLASGPTLSLALPPPEPPTVPQADVPPSPDCSPQSPLCPLPSSARSTALHAAGTAVCPAPASSGTTPPSG